MKHTSGIVKSLISVGGLKLISLPLSMLVSILLARFMVPEDYGNYLFVISISTLLSLPFGVGLGQFITREIAAFHKSQDWEGFKGFIHTLKKWCYGGGGAIAMAAISLSFYMASWEVGDRWTLMSVAALLVPISVFNALRASILRGLKFVFYSQLCDLFVRPVFQIATVLLLWFFFKIDPLVAIIAYIFSMAVASLLGWFFLLKKMPAEVGEASPVYSSEGWLLRLLPFYLLVTIEHVNSQLGSLVLGWLGEPEDIAMLQVAASWAMIVILPRTIFSVVLAPYITEAKGNKERTRYLAKKSSRAIFLLSAPVVLMLIAFPGQIVGYTHGEQYVLGSTLPLLILVVGQLINLAFGSVGLFLVMSGNERDALVSQTLGLLMSLLLSIMLAESYGPSGVAFGIAVGRTVWTVMMSYRFYKKLGFRSTII